MTTEAKKTGMDEMQTVNALELTSIKALVAFAAFDKQMSEDIVREVFASRFGIDTVDKLPANRYDDAIRFLVDMEPAVIH